MRTEDNGSPIISPHPRKAGAMLSRQSTHRHTHPGSRRPSLCPGLSGSNSPSHDSICQEKSTVTLWGTCSLPVVRAEQPEKGLQGQDGRQRPRPEGRFSGLVRVQAFEPKASGLACGSSLPSGVHDSSLHPLAISAPESQGV